jgi:hypothetical protein
MKNLMACSFALVFSFALTASAKGHGADAAKPSAARRAALVIGNAAYATAPLANPINDARDMAETLRDLGFDVFHGENMKLKEMKDAIRDFGNKSRHSDVSLFYYAGHGLQVNQLNYLVPVDAKLEREAQVEYECIPAGLVLAQMEGAGSRANIIILDACRDNPFPRGFRSGERGLARMDAPGGTLIAYATKPGFTADDGPNRNGLYTQELLKFIRVPGLKVQDVFYKVRASVVGLTEAKPKPQVPWEETSLVGDVCFVEPCQPAVITSTVSPEELLVVIKSQQQSEVKESYGEYRGQNFSDEDLKAFKEKNTPQAVAERLRRDGHFIDVVLAIKRMEPGARQQLLGVGVQTYRKTWAELGRMSREGQTEAGQEADRLIAKAIVDLVKELYNLPVEKLEKLRN